MAPKGHGWQLFGLSLPHASPAHSQRVWIRCSLA